MTETSRSVFQTHGSGPTRSETTQSTPTQSAPTLTVSTHSVPASSISTRSANTVSANIVSRNSLAITLLFLAILSLTSCEKLSSPTTVQVINNITPFDTDIPSLDGTLWDANLYYFGKENDGKFIPLGHISSGGDSTRIYELPKKVERIKVGFKFFGPEFEYYRNRGNFRYYILAYTFVDKGDHHELVIDDRTFYSSKINYGSQEALTLEDVLVELPFAED